MGTREDVIGKWSRLVWCLPQKPSIVIRFITIWTHVSFLVCAFFHVCGLFVYALWQKKGSDRQNQKERLYWLMKLRLMAKKAKKCIDVMVRGQVNKTWKPHQTLVIVYLNKRDGDLVKFVTIGKCNDIGYRGNGGRGPGLINAAHNLGIRQQSCVGHGVMEQDCQALVGHTQCECRRMHPESGSDVPEGADIQDCSKQRLNALRSFS